MTVSAWPLKPAPEPEDGALRVGIQASGKSNRRWLSAPKHA